MSADSYSFRVGEIECAVLLDGATVMGPGPIVKRFPGADEATYRRAYAEIGLSLDDADSSFNVFVATIGDETILVDSGEGGRPTGGELPASMRLAGFEPAAITQVVITHSHGDHVLGLLTDDHEPVFPNARYVIAADEMPFWQSRIDTDRADQRAIVAMMEARGLRLIEMDEQIVPGLRAVPLAGHTPGHIGLLLESQAEALLIMADLLHSPMQFAHPDWSPTFDADTTQSVPVRRAALARAADEQLQALFYHLTFPGLGRVRRGATGFVWEPVAPAR